MNVLGIPVDLPTRVIGRALSDLGDLARVAREIPSQLDDVQRRLDRALELAETIDRRMGPGRLIRPSIRTSGQRQHH